MFCVGPCRLGLDELRDLRAGKEGIGVAARLIGRARKSEVGNRRQNGNSGKSRVDGGGFASKARREEGCPSGVRSESDQMSVPPGKCR
jgi:hypothetical protein